MKSRPFAKNFTKRMGMDAPGCAKVLSNDFSILSRPDKQQALEQAKEESRKLLGELQKAREIDPEQLREPCSL